MSVYVIGQLKFLNEQSYRKYQSRFAEVFVKYNGRLLAADENPIVLEGKWDKDKFVLMSFPDARNARRFLESPEYTEISQDRKLGAETVALLIEGLK